MPFKTKISAWYGFFMVLLLSVILVFVYLSSATSLLNQTENKIDETLEESKEYITYKNGTFDFSDNLSEFEEISVLIYDQYGNTLYGTPPKRFNVEEKFRESLSTIQLPNNNQYVYKDTVVTLDEAPFDIVIRVIATYTSINLTLRSFLTASLILGPLGLLFAIYGGYKLMNAIFKPIETISETALQITQNSDLSLRITEDKHSDELGQLISSINHMLDKIENAFKREQQFTQDISHELRTPLTSMLLDVEMLLVEESYDEDILKRIQTQTEWMAFLIESMKESTQDLQVAQKESFPLKPFLQHLIRDYQETIHCFVLEDQMIEADKLLLSRILTNLLNNSFQYGATMVKVYYNQSKQLILEDDGIGIEQEHLDKIWDRFYQTEKSRSTHTLGLGLYFVSGAIKALGWKIEVESEAGEYTRFIIST